jgi:phosphoglycerol transferase MdoB-like AlkP superfamily enzyme
MGAHVDKLRASSTGLRALLSGRDWIYLLSLLGPLVVYNLALKLIRIFSLNEQVGAFEVFGLIRSDLLFNLGYALLWIGLFALTRRGPLRWLTVYLLLVATVLVAAITTCAHIYFRETGLTLDLNTIVYSLAELGEIKEVITSVASPAAWALLVAVLAYVLLGPLLVTRLVLGRPDASAAVDTSVPWRTPLFVCLAALALASLSLVAGSGGGASKSFSRDAVVNVFFSGVQRARLENSTRDIHTAARKPPLDTRLGLTEQTQKRNVVLIHLESVRARSVTPYNEDIKTTPFLDDLVQKSLMAERAYTVVPHTSKAITAVNCGIEPHLVRAITETEPGGIPARCLPELLKEQGYRSVWFSSAVERFEDRRELVGNFGYDDFHPVDYMVKEGFDRSNYFGYEDNIMLDPSSEWLERHRGKPFVAKYLGVTGHHPYNPIDRYGRKKFAEKPGLNRYQNEVRYLDFFVKNVIDQYKQLGLYNNTIFVIYGDHGEGFGEHDLYQHDDTIYEEGLRIPLIIHDPQRFQDGKRVDTLANQLDILPTIFDLLGYEVKGDEYPGRSLLAPPDRDRTLFFSCFHDYECLASLKGTQKYIYFFGDRPEEVYDLSSDPMERHNLADEISNQELNERRNELLAWFSRVNATYESENPGTD